MSLKKERCPYCGTLNWVDRRVKGVQKCGGCPAVIDFPVNLEGPGSRPKEDDIRWFGTEQERADKIELEQLRDVDKTSAGPTTAGISEEKDEIVERRRRTALEELEARVKDTGQDEGDKGEGSAEVTVTE